MDNLKIMRNKCESLLSEAIAKKDKKRIVRLEQSMKFLQNDDCFIGADELEATYVLIRLGYTFEQAAEIYEYFNKVEFFSGKLEYIDIDGNSVYFDALLNPSFEQYYRFSDGTVFKCDNSGIFYYLIDGKWVYDANIQKKFYDSGYDYDRLRCIIDRNFSPRR